MLVLRIVFPFRNILEKHKCINFLDIKVDFMQIPCHLWPSFRCVFGKKLQKNTSPTTLFFVRGSILSESEVTDLRQVELRPKGQGPVPCQVFWYLTGGELLQAAPPVRDGPVSDKARFAHQVWFSRTNKLQ